MNKDPQKVFHWRMTPPDGAQVVSNGHSIAWIDIKTPKNSQNTILISSKLRSPFRTFRILVSAKSSTHLSDCEFFHYKLQICSSSYHKKPYDLVEISKFLVKRKHDHWTTQKLYFRKISEHLRHLFKFPDHREHWKIMQRMMWFFAFFTFQKFIRYLQYKNAFTIPRPISSFTENFRTI